MRKQKDFRQLRIPFYIHNECECMMIQKLASISHWSEFCLKRTWFDCTSTIIFLLYSSTHPHTQILCSSIDRFVCVCLSVSSVKQFQSSFLSTIRMYVCALDLESICGMCHQLTVRWHKHEPIHMLKHTQRHHWYVHRKCQYLKKAPKHTHKDT